MVPSVVSADYSYPRGAKCDSKRLSNAARSATRCERTAGGQRPGGRLEGPPGRSSKLWVVGVFSARTPGPGSTGPKFNRTSRTRSVDFRPTLTPSPRAAGISPQFGWGGCPAMGRGPRSRPTLSPRCAVEGAARRVRRAGALVYFPRKNGVTCVSAGLVAARGGAPRLESSVRHPPPGVPRFGSVALGWLPSSESGVGVCVVGEGRPVVPDLVAFVAFEP